MVLAQRWHLKLKHYELRKYFEALSGLKLNRVSIKNELQQKFKLSANDAFDLTRIMIECEPSIESDKWTVFHWPTELKVIIPYDQGIHPTYQQHYIRSFKTSKNENC